MNTNRIPPGLPGGIIVYDAQEDAICFADQNIVRLYGCTTFEEFMSYVHGRFSGMVHPDDRRQIQKDIDSQILGGKKRHDYLRYRIVTKQGDVRYVEDFGHLLHGADGRQYFYVCIVDVDKDEYFNKASNSLAESQVLGSIEDIDRLTGLLGMQAFHRVAQQTYLGDARRKGPVTFAHFDILNFKVINEELGFERGDELLRSMARALTGEFGDGLVGRFANDHFVVCAPIDGEEMSAHINRIHNVIANSTEGIHPEVKAGIYMLEDACTKASHACDCARMACNIVKRRYDKVCGVYDARLYEHLRLQSYVTDKVDEAVRKNYVKVFYQPIVRVETGKICGYEALARWDDPVMGFLPPSRCILTLENFRMTHEVDCHVIHNVCEDLHGLIVAGEPTVPVSVNLSRLDFDLCDIFTEVEQYLIEYEVPRSLIDIEITESAMNEDSKGLVSTVQKFRDAGYRVWVDDFGSGYSALNTLMDYDFDVLKLDLEFLRTFDENPRAGELIEHIVSVAKSMGVQMLQEGVERPEHLEFLHRIGCDMVQGYLFAKPMPLAESRAYTRANGLSWE